MKFEENFPFRVCVITSLSDKNTVFDAQCHYVSGRHDVRMKMRSL